MGNNSLGVNQSFWSYWLICKSYFAEHYCCLLFTIVFKIITKNSKISQKLPIQGQQPNNWLSDSSANFRADRSWPDKQFYPCQISSKCFGFLVISQKTAFYPYVLFVAMVAILVGLAGHATHFLNYIPQWWLWQSLV